MVTSIRRLLLAITDLILLGLPLPLILGQISVQGGDQQMRSGW
jgi:hypothetical protein